MRFEVHSWNVNGLRAADRKGFRSWLGRTRADVVLLQEVRARADQLRDAVRAPRGWHAAFFPAERHGYSGVAVYSRDAPDELHRGLGVKKYDCEGRALAARFGSLLLVSAYFPMGRHDLSRVPYKLGFYRAMLRRMREWRDEGLQVVVSGDFNTAHSALDLARPKQNVRNTGFRPEERAWLDRYVAAGWRDSFRLRHPHAEGAYTWWSNRMAARERNVGWRIDHHFVDEALTGRVLEAGISGRVKGSDHCPVTLTLEA